MTLYEITDSMKTLLDLIEEEDSEFSEEALFDTFALTESDYLDKAENYGQIIKTLESDIALCKSEEARIESYRKRTEEKINFLTRTLKCSMEILDKPKFKAGTFNFALRNNPVRLEISTEENIPEKYYKPVPPVLDKVLLKNDIKNGSVVEGVELVSNTRLVIS